MKLIYLPSGPKNIAIAFPSVDVADIDQYRVQLKSSTEVILASSNLYSIIKGCENSIRLHFLNSLGCIDAVTFDEVSIVHENTSETWKTAPKVPLQKDKHSVNRFNVKAGDRYLAKTFQYNEDDQPWLEELFDSPIAWMEWKGIQGQPDSYIPVVISDSKFEKLKAEENYIYTAEVTFALSHPKFIIR